MMVVPTPWGPVTLPGLPNLSQWTRDRLIDVLARIESDVRKQRDQISTMNGQVIELDRQARRITDPRKRAAALEAIKGLVRRQEQLVAAWRVFSQRTGEAVAKGRAFLGAERGGQLGDLGIVAVPVQVATVAGIALAASLWIAGTIAVQLAQLAKQRGLQQAVINGQVTPEQAVTMTQQWEREARAQAPQGDPLGITNIVEALVPIGLILLAVVVAPPLLEAMSGRRSRARA